MQTAKIKNLDKTVNEIISNTTIANKPKEFILPIKFFIKFYYLTLVKNGYTEKDANTLIKSFISMINILHNTK